MAGAEYRFPTPELVLLVGANPPASGLARELERKLKTTIPHIACLAAEVEKKHLGNTLACMKLMDLRGIILHDALSAACLSCGIRCDATAKRGGHIDVIRWKGGKPLGTSALIRGISTWVRAQGAHRKAAMIGSFDHAGAVNAALLAGGVRKKNISRIFPRSGQSMSDVLTDVDLVLWGKLPKRVHAQWKKAMRKHRRKVKTCDQSHLHKLQRATWIALLKEQQ